MSSSIANKALSKMLASPEKIAHHLDWRKVSGSVLSLNILRDRIEVVVASHPSLEDGRAYKLPTVPLKTHLTSKTTREMDAYTLEELSKVVKDHNVCGLVVHWPVQEEGWTGAACGRVLHTLDQLAQKKVISPSRPACLWDTEHKHFDEDSWGRSAIYSQTSSKPVHVASQEQYGDRNTVVVDIWNDFCHAHWPELYQDIDDTEEYLSPPSPPAVPPPMPRNKKPSDSPLLQAYKNTSTTNSNRNAPMRFIQAL